MRIAMVSEHAPTGKGDAMTSVVVGDVMLDRDLDGRAERLSPNAPVPVVDEVREHTRPGGTGLAAWLAAEDTPERILRRLRPDVGVKGGDHTVEELPEASVVAGWGGRTVVLPYLPGRSTTGILARRT